MKYIKLMSLFIPAVCCLFAGVAVGQSNADVYDKIRMVRGEVRFTDHPELGNTPANFMFIVFRRVGCDDCLVGVETDIDGKYSLFVGEGTYEVIVYNPTDPVYDMLAPDQPRQIRVGTEDKTVFNIDLKLMHEAAEPGSSGRSVVAGEIGATEKRRLGDDVVSRVEAFKATHGKLPDSLSDIGIKETEDGPIYYQEISDDRYEVWYGAALGESVTYDSQTKEWLPK